jgi:hypothetical protein
MRNVRDLTAAEWRKPWSEAELPERIRAGELQLPPAALRLVESEPRTPFGSRPDGVLEAAWGERTGRFVFEYKNLSTPKALDAAVSQARRYAAETGLLPLVLVPFLAEERLYELEREGISGVDLSGNGVLRAPDFAIFRTGAPNRYRESQQGIKNVYRGTSALFARCFLLRPAFDSLSELIAFAQSRWNVPRDPLGTSRMTAAALTKGTAPKVVQALDAEFIISRNAAGLSLMDPQRLLDRLRQNYRPPAGVPLAGETPLSAADMWKRLGEAPRPLRYVATGAGSAGRYGVLSGPDQLSLYVTDLDAAASLLQVRATRVFPNIRLIEEKSDVVYFDIRLRGGEQWASPVQVWLELATGGPRERDAAGMLETALLQGHAEEMP